MLAVIMVAILVYVVAGIQMWHLGRLWINPMTFILAYYFFNYPIRAILVLYFPDVYNKHGFDDSDVMAALTYSTIYVVFFVGAYLAILKTQRIEFVVPTFSDTRLDIRLFFVSAALTLLAGAVTMGYEISIGGAFSLGADIEELRRPFWVNAFGVFSTLKWFSLCLGILTYLRTRATLVLLTSLLLLGLIVVEGVLSTGKGLFAAIIMMFLFLDNLLTGRTVRLPIVLVGGLVLVFFSAYSYYARYYIGFGEESEGGLGNMIAFLSSGELVDLVGDQLENILNRGTYYLDALTLMIKDGLGVDPGPYAFGSVVEIVNIIPRAAGFDLEQYSFDRHVSESVWRTGVFVQIFIGRIGESFFVLGYFGIVYALINGVIFAFVASRWRSSSASLSGISLYLAILLSWLHQDASLFYQIKSLLYVLLAFWVVKLIARYVRVVG
ncbi:MAG: hypothetical protein Q8M11_15030 [Sulfuritalea sp.]|nr:hypothetical protein [Sulfuritalea sp.]